jgi:hypothetical protein
MSADTLTRFAAVLEEAERIGIVDPFDDWDDVEAKLDAIAEEENES